jgi:ABC-type transporter MlaC component
MQKPFSVTLIYVAFFAALAVSIFASPSMAADCPAGRVVKSAAAVFMDAARRESGPAFASALARYTDLRGMALFALGQYRSKLPAARHGEYVRNTHFYMTRFLLRNARSFRSSRTLVIEVCNGNIVETSLDGRSRMVWRLSGGRIRDVQVSGVWLALQLRSKFTGILRRNDGDPDALIAFLRRSRD